MTRLSILAFCSTIFLAACSSSKTSHLASQPQPATNGIALYEEYCASCHRPFAQTTKPQRSVSRLRSSINLFPSMRSLGFLSNAQLEAVSSALATIDLHQAARDK